MTRASIRYVLAAALAVFTAIGPAVAASAQEEDEAPPATETTFAPGGEPAVIVQETAPPEDDPAWTFRYLVPTLITLSGLALAAVVVGYGVRVKGRYRVAR